LLQVALHALQRVCLKNFFGAVAVFSDFFCVLCFINFYVFLNFLADRELLEDAEVARLASELCVVHALLVLHRGDPLRALDLAEALLDRLADLLEPVHVGVLNLVLAEIDAAAAVLGEVADLSDELRALLGQLADLRRALLLRLEARFLGDDQVLESGAVLAGDRLLEVVVQLLKVKELGELRSELGDSLGLLGGRLLSVLGSLDLRLLSVLGSLDLRLLSVLGSLDLRLLRVLGSLRLRLLRVLGSLRLRLLSELGGLGGLLLSELGGLGGLLLSELGSLARLLRLESLHLLRLAVLLLRLGDRRLRELAGDLRLGRQLGALLHHLPGLRPGLNEFDRLLGVKLVVAREGVHDLLDLVLQRLLELLHASGRHYELRVVCGFVRACYGFRDLPNQNDRKGYQFFFSGVVVTN